MSTEQAEAYPGKQFRDDLLEMFERYRVNPSNGNQYFTNALAIVEAHTAQAVESFAETLRVNFEGDIRHDMLYPERRRLTVELLNSTIDNLLTETLSTGNSNKE